MTRVKLESGGRLLDQFEPVPHAPPTPLLHRSMLAENPGRVAKWRVAMAIRVVLVQLKLERVFIRHRPFARPDHTRPFLHKNCNVKLLRDFTRSFPVRKIIRSGS
jgi:hypothetical protein